MCGFVGFHLAAMVRCAQFFAHGIIANVAMRTHSPAFCSGRVKSAHLHSVVPGQQFWSLCLWSGDGDSAGGAANETAWTSTSKMGHIGLNDVKIVPGVNDFAYMRTRSFGWCDLLRGKFRPWVTGVILRDVANQTPR